MLLLGISAYYHDSSAALIKDGKIVCAVQEERFTRVKHDSAFPLNSISFCLNDNNLKIQDIDFICYYESPKGKKKRFYENSKKLFPNNLYDFLDIISNGRIFNSDPENDIFALIESFGENPKKWKNRILFSEHHFSHAASAFFPSPFKESLVITIDGIGEMATTTIGIGNGNNLSLTEEIHFPNSLGLLYSAFTKYCGFKVNSGEYKLMGLAPYGESKFVDKILENVITLHQDGSFKLNEKYFNFQNFGNIVDTNLETLLGKNSRLPESDLDTHYLNVAASIQKVLEMSVENLVTHARKKYNRKNLCLSGGVALNCVCNGKLLEKKIFDKLWIQPASGDAGCSIGAGLAVYYTYLKKERKVNINDSMNGSFLGPQFKSDDILRCLELYKLPYQYFEDEKEMINNVVNKICKEKCVGWFQGRMEFGPRALGARSIVADPRPENMQSKLNLKIKFRESFRPFAPAILDDEEKNFFSPVAKNPYMLSVATLKDEHFLDVGKEKKNEKLLVRLKNTFSKYPAITHVDRTSRVQIISEQNNRLFYKLLKEFFSRTECPMLANTSFNVRGEPIVNTPEDAIKCFLGTELDILCIGPYLIDKDKMDSVNSKFYYKNFELD